MKIRSLIYPFFLVSSLVLTSGCFAQKTDLPADEFEKVSAQPNAQILDVRTPGEFQTGHLAHALLADWTNRTEFLERVKSLDKDRPVYTYCLSGGRSRAAMEWLNKNGFKAFNLSGGMQAWKLQNKPVEVEKAVPQISMQEYLASIPADKTVLVDFSADWCPPCRKMEPLIKELQASHGPEFTLVKIDGAAQTSLSKEMHVTGFPTFIIYKKGKEAWRKEGLTDKAELIKQLGLRI